MRWTVRRRLLIAACGVLTVPAAALASPTPVTVVPDEAGAVTPLPPTQPETGPHGSSYPFPGRPSRLGVSGLGGFTIYEPRDEAGNPPGGPVPLILMLRGACVGSCSMTMTNNMKNAWRDHLAKKGNIVVFPHYQLKDDPELELANVAGAMHMAIRALTEPGYVASRPDLDWESDKANGRAYPDLSRVGFVGHSRGSQMAVKLAARIYGRGGFSSGTLLPPGSSTQSLGLPRPDWLLIVEPGPTSFSDFSDLGVIPGSVRLAVVVGEDDNLAGEDKAKVVWAAASRVPDAHREYVRVRSHRRGPWALASLPAQGCDDAAERVLLAEVVTCMSTGMVWNFTPRPQAEVRNVVNPAAQTGDLVADHSFPGGGSALDVFALWKISQGLVECTSSDLPCTTDPNMGTWSDGVPVNRICITDDPDETWDASCEERTTSTHE